MEVAAGSGGGGVVTGASPPPPPTQRPSAFRVGRGVARLVVYACVSTCTSSLRFYGLPSCMTLLPQWQCCTAGGLQQIEGARVGRSMCVHVVYMQTHLCSFQPAVIVQVLCAAQGARQGRSALNPGNPHPLPPNTCSQTARHRPGHPIYIRGARARTERSSHSRRIGCFMRACMHVRTQRGPVSLGPCRAAGATRMMTTRLPCTVLVTACTTGQSAPSLPATAFGRRGRAGSIETPRTTFILRKDATHHIARGPHPGCRSPPALLWYTTPHPRIVVVLTEPVVLAAGNLLRLYLGRRRAMGAGPSSGSHAGSGLPERIVARLYAALVARDTQAFQASGRSCIRRITAGKRRAAHAWVQEGQG